MAFQTNEITITQDNLTHVVCPEGNTGSISVSISGGTGTLSYSWAGPGTFTRNTEDISNLAEGTYTLTVTDQTTPTAVTKSATFTIIQEDLEDPVLTAPADKTISADFGLCTASNVSLGSATMSDNCGVSSIKNDAPTTFPLGTTTVTWTASDADGNTTTDVQIITVNDTEKPFVRTRSLTVSLGPNGNATITKADIENGSTDNCGISTVSLSKTNFTCADVGQNAITLSVTDNNGNSASETTMVTVEDNVAPAVVTKDITIELDASGKAVIAEDAVNNGSSDACGELSFDTNITSFDCTDLGANTVSLTVKDSNGNSASENATVTVVDKITPTVTTQNLTVQLDATGKAVITEDAVNNGSSDACGGLTFDTDITTFVCTNIGANTVRLTVTDSNGNSTSETATVTVEDNIAPTVVTQNISIELDATGNAVIAEDAVNNGSSDACGGISFDTNITSFDCTNIGANTVTLTVTDDNGNSTSETATVTVEDNTAPTVVTQNISIELDATGNAIIAEDAVNDGSSDACAGLIFDTDITAFDCTDVGVNDVILTVIDSNGNSASGTATVTVLDNTAPSVTTQDIIVQLDASGNASIAEDAVNGSTSDSCGGLTFDTDVTTFNCSNVGENTVVITVTDSNGNSASGSATVTVVDNEIPVISSVNEINTNTDAGLCNATIAIEPPVVSDNCGSSVPTGTRSDGQAMSAPYPVGTTTITWSAKDNNNNLAVEVQQTVTVSDNEAPVAPQLEPVVWGCEYTVTPPVAIDNCEGEITATGNRSLVFPVSGTITWTFTDSKGNSSSVPQEVIINQIEVGVNTQDILCNGFATGGAEAVVTNGIAPFTYDWGILGTGPSKDGLSPGNYEVTVTDVNGCTAHKEFVISEPESFIEITNININKGCFGQNNAKISFTATGGTTPLTYFLNDAQVPGTTIENLAPGTYSLKVVDDNGCSQEETVTINEPDELIITNIVTTETNTFGSSTGTATVILEGGTPNYTFEWSNGQTTQVATGLTAGEYSVTVTDANGCTASKSTIVIDPLEAVMLPISKCLSDDGGLRTSTFQVESVRGGIAPYTYHWDFGGETTNGVSTAEGEGVHVVDYIATGTYTITLTVTDSAGNEFIEILDYYVGECFEACGKTGNLDFVNSFYVGKEDGSILTSSECEGYTGKIYIYLNIEKNANAYNPSVEFIYTITDPQNQEVISEERITGCVPMEGNGKIPEIFRIGEVNNWSCGYAVNLENFYMDWTNGSHKPCGDVRQKMCVSTNEKDEIKFPLSATVNVTRVYCHGSNEGVIKVNASGGAGAYTYTVKNLGTSETITQTSFLFENLPAGIYDVTVSDNNDSYTRRNIEIIQPDNALLLEEISNTPLICNGGNDATSTVRASGGTAPYTIVWDHISQTSTEDTGTATNLSAGFYTVRVVDNNGCEISTEIEIVEPPVAVADAGPDQELGCGVDQVNLGAIFEDYTNPATGEMEFGKWTVINGPAGSAFSDANDPAALFSISATGTYTLRWTVPCGAYDDVKIIFRNCSTIDFDGQDDYIDFSSNYNLSGDFTIEAWIKQNPSTSAGLKTILSKKDVSSPTAGGFDLIIENDIPKFRWNDSSLSSDFPINTARWYHIAVIKGGPDEGLYVDGIKVSDGNLGIPGSSTSPFLIGAAYDSNSTPLPKNFFHGWIEEVRIWGTALNLTQLRFMMNQRILNNGKVRGETLPLDVPENLNWSNLTAYYRLMTAEATNGITKNRIDNGIHGRLKNIQSTQDNTAPLPYYTGSTGTWDGTPWAESEVWDAPNSIGIDGNTRIEWNIAEVSHDISSGNRDITLLGLISKKGKLSVSKMGNNASEYDPGQSLRITDYLELNGTIDLVGESQLLQDHESIFAETSSGYIERDQQGTASSFNYNYWSSPVAPQGTANNSPYTVQKVLRDGSNPANPIPLVFNNSFQFADWKYSGAKRISSYWLHIYTNNTSNTYSQWQHVGENGTIKAAEGYSMKGTSGSAKITDRQNYTYIGKPNNGTIELTLDAGNDYLIGNPYPSAIDSEKFILDNLSASGGNNSQNIFNGTIYFWDHFSGKSHYLQEYVGGYATLNLSGGVVAVATDERINANGESAEENSIPLQYIPVGQAFLVSTQTNTKMPETISGGNIIFQNTQRIFKTDDQAGDESIFKTPENEKPETKNGDKRPKIFLYFKSPQGYLRQLLVTNDVRSTSSFDLGFDAPLIENNKEDMYWMIDSIKSVIQGVPDFDKQRVLPLGVKIKDDGDFSISIDTTMNLSDDFRIYIKDSVTEITHDLQESTYKTSATGGSINNRFSIVFNKETPAIEEEKPVEEIPTGWFELYYSSNNNEIGIKNPRLQMIKSGAVYNILGQKIQEFHNIPLERLVKLPVIDLPEGVYIMKLRLKEGNSAIKFIKE
ncbi:hypothetical protein GCM10007103_05990 [Salinimicrobium marinum]|uniref:Por secretion system C-terminal sorting domain-containing protein n=2 Tax=Salinimicrobium marinum TaxID=680283 RepID=A0A918S6S6_9FLAO|nr:hypothetical protein GCM10007103_05990 [Salinimicrobium marinum]